MPSDAAKQRAAKKKEARKAAVAKRNDKTIPEKGPKKDGNGDSVASSLAAMQISTRTCTGVLTSHPSSRDVHFESFSLTFHGLDLLTDTKLELNWGRRYGLVGLNGCGKSSLLSALGARELPIPSHVDIFHLTSEVEASDKTPIQCVLEVDAERNRLEEEASELAHNDSEAASERLMGIYERLDELESATAEMRAGEILHGLGFTKEMQEMKARDFSGGWRMRIALAKCLFVGPSLLLLDEPTNHLDLEACVWLEDALTKYRRILLLVSHSQDFLNNVCTNVLHFHQKKLKSYSGNYDAFVKTRLELEEHQMKRYKWEQDQIAHMKDYIARFGHGHAKLARQAQSKEKVLAKMVDGGLAEKVIDDKTLEFSFPDCGPIPPPVIMVQDVSFRYGDDKPLIYNKLDFGLDLDSRVALVGANGAGKSTLLKLIDGELIPTEGIVRRNGHLRIKRFHQHLHDTLDLDLSAVDHLMKCFPAVSELEQMRKAVGRFGLTGKQQMCPMKNLSDGQRSRVVFAWLAWNTPHILLLDEPTNHLDIETIDSLAAAINQFEGGVILVSHDFRLISQVAQEIWVCEKQGVNPWKGDILSYKEKLRRKVLRKQKKKKV